MSVSTEAEPHSSMQPTSTSRWKLVALRAEGSGQTTVDNATVAKLLARKHLVLDDRKMTWIDEGAGARLVYQESVVRDPHAAGRAATGPAALLPSLTEDTTLALLVGWPYADPNTFLRQPPARRSLKYAVADSFDWGKPIFSNVVAAPSKTSFHCLYKRNNLPVLATFRSEDIIMTLYAELASSFKAENENSFLSTDMLASFKRMSGEERAHPELARQKLQSMSRNFLGTVPRSGENSSRGGGSTTRRSGTGQGGRKSQQSNRKGSTTSAEGARITKTNLDALQDALGTDIGAAKDLAKASILHSSYDRVMDPGDAAVAAAHLRQ